MAGHTGHRDTRERQRTMMPGKGVLQTSRRIAFRVSPILAKRVMVVPDATADERFAGNALATGPADLRFYDGAPLLTPEGLLLGTFCILDTRPHHAFGAEDLGMGMAIVEQHSRLLGYHVKVTSEPRAPRISSTSRRFKLEQWYSHTASLMIAAGKRKPRYGLGVVLMAGKLPHAAPSRQPDNTLPIISHEDWPGAPGSQSHRTRHRRSGREPVWRRGWTRRRARPCG